MKTKLPVLTFLAILSCFLIISISLAGTTRRISVNELGEEGNGESWYPSKVATNGKIAFVSLASNLAAGDTNQGWDTFVYDITTGIITRASLANDGTEPNGNESLFPAISGNGNTISFQSDANNLVENDNNQLTDIFVRNLGTPLGPLSRANLTYLGAESNGQVNESWLNGDGTLVIFDSYDDTLVESDTNGRLDIFLRDLVNNTTTLVSVAQDGTQGNGPSFWPNITPDGNFAVFSSRSTNLIPGGTNGREQIFVKNLVTNEIELVSKHQGVMGNKNSVEPSISEDGRYIAFLSWADNLTDDIDGNAQADIFVHDRVTGLCERVNVHTGGSEANGFSDMWKGSISGDGRFVVFSSRASNLVDDDTNGFDDVFLHDRLNHTTERVSVASDGTQANGTSDLLAFISSDGRYVSFESDANNLDQNIPDNNGAWDIFVHDRYDNDGDGYAHYDECDDSDIAVNPGVVEICKDNIDNNCDGLIDDDSCVKRFEVCDDGIDNDNDNKIDCNDNDCKRDPLCL